MVPALRYDEALDRWVTTEMYEGRAINGTLFRIPASFPFDLASVPRIFWPLIAPFELGCEAALVHDYFYVTGGKPFYGAFRRPGLRLTRAQVDRQFLNMMRNAGVPRWRRVVAYAAVRLFGWIAFRA